MLEATPFTVEELEPALKQLGVEKEWSVKDNFMLLRAIVTGKTASPPLLESHDRLWQGAVAGSRAALH